MLNPESPLPLYQQLAERVRADIKAGLYVAHQKIPSETELANLHGIGRPTVRQATDLLVREGVLQRRRGSGTYVLPTRTKIDLFSLAGSSAAFFQSEQQVNVELLAAVHLETFAHSTPSSLAGCSVFALQRLYRLEEEPVVLESIYLDAQQFHGLDQHPLNAGMSLSALVRDQYFMEPVSAEQLFSIVFANAEQSDSLAVSRQTPLLLVQRTLYFAARREQANDELNGAVYCEILCRTDRHSFSQLLYPTNTMTGGSV